MEQEDSLISIRAKLSRAGVKITTIIAECEQIDKNNDSLLHMDDLEAVLVHLLGNQERNAISKREMRVLMSCLTNSRDKAYCLVEYPKLVDILYPREAQEKRKEAQPERWFDGGEVLSESKATSSRMKSGKNRSMISSPSGPEYWARQRGSVGEWLTRAAAPAEIKNFKRLIACLETFERESGVSIEQAGNGAMVIPLGPGLTATLNFGIKE